MKAEIPNPVTLNFVVSEAAWTEETTVFDQGRNLAAIPLREIFADDLERTLWLAIKCRHITSQYFHHQIREAAQSIRREPPVDPFDFHTRIELVVGSHGNRGERCADPFCAELFRYVLSVLDGGDFKLAYTEKRREATQ